MIAPSEKWSVARTRHIPAMWPVSAYFNWDYASYFEIPNSGKAMHIWENGDVVAIYETGPRKILVDAVRKKLNESTSLSTLRERGLKSGESVVKYFEGIASEIQNKNIDDIIRFLDTLSEKHMPIMRDNMFFWVILSGPIEKEIREQMSGIPNEQIDEIFSIMSQPQTTSYSHAVEQSLNTLVEQARVNGIDNILGEIESFSKKYFWFPYEYIGPNIWTIETIEKIIREKLEKVPDPKHTDNRSVSEKQIQIVKKYNLKDEVVGLFTILQTLTLMQDDRKMFMSQMCYYINHVIFCDIAKRFNLTINQARFLDADLLRKFKDDSDLLKRELSNRIAFVVGLHEHGKLAIYTGDTAREYLKSIDIVYGQKIDNVKEIKGQIANKGLACGRVRVLKTSHVEDFQPGDVIVTGMTTPDFAPLMKLASAIVTNEGGITCHAAIVSRELNKPCVIGTKIATKVLKDGDMVEVDANTGLITILKS